DGERRCEVCVLQVADFEPEKAGANGAEQFVMQLKGVLAVSGKRSFDPGVTADDSARWTPGNLCAASVVASHDGLGAGAEALGFNINKQLLAFFTRQLRLQDLRTTDNAAVGRLQVERLIAECSLGQTIDAEHEGTGDAAGIGEANCVEAGWRGGVERDFDFE